MIYTTRARVVLNDVQFVRNILEGEKGWVEWRLWWVTAVTLTRAIGHVLVKVDGAEFPEVRAIANKLHKQWKGTADEHAIFRDFIEQERNSILKEYEFGMSEGPIALVGRSRDPISGKIHEEHGLIEENIYRPMWSGPYEGEDGRTLLDEAILWWADQLDLIDLEAARRFKGE